MRQVSLFERLSPTRAQLWYSIPFFFIVQKCFRENLPLLDFWWHLKMGQIILDGGAIPRIDTFSFTATGKPFVVQNWLAEIFLYALYVVGGRALLILFNTAIFVAVIFILWRVSLRLSQSMWASVFATIIVAVCLPVNIRPQIFSFLLFALFYWVLSSWNTGCLKRIYWLPVLMVAWVNLHGAFVLGLGLMAIFLAVECINLRVAAVAGDNADPGRALHLGAAFMASLLAALANPEGYRIFHYIGSVVNDASSRLFVSEWQPPHIMELAGILLFFIPFFLTVTALILSEQRPRLVDWVLFTAFAMFGITALRNCAWFQLISAPILARHLPMVPWKSMTRLWRPDFLRKSWFAFSPDSGKVRRINIAVAALLIFLVAVRSPWWRNFANHDTLLDEKTPVLAANFIAERRLEGNIFHPQIYGDYLLWRLWPEQKIFFDGRVHLYGKEFVESYLKIFGDSDWQDRLARFDIRYILLSKSEPDNEGLIGKVKRSGAWKPLHEDQVSILWEKR